jgi:hypothetical protein
MTTGEEWPSKQISVKLGERILVLRSLLEEGVGE